MKGGKNESYLKYIFVVCPSCGYLVKVLSNKTIETTRKNGNKKCENCKKDVDWSIYGESIFSYIKEKNRLIFV